VAVVSRVAYFLTIIKFIGGPGSLGFFLAGFLAALLAWRYWPAGRRAVAWTVGALMAVYVTLALPTVALALVDALRPISPPSPDAVRSIRALVVFDGDNRAGRQRRALRVLRLATPGTVHLLGADYLLADLRVAVAPGTTVHYDATTWNTATQVVRVQQIAEQWPPMTTAVIASRLQMPRIATMLEAARTSVLLVPSGLDREPVSSGLASCLPSLAALAASREAIYEHVALAWYRWRGDIQ
jgi:hypothetical protein